jgi:single-stranded-DNA-specific exonuclease
MMMVAKRWAFTTYNEDKALALQNSLHIRKSICNILAQRNITDFENAKAFFRPDLTQLHDPFLMKDMQKAVNRIATAIAANEKIMIYGDYDVDGTTSVATMYAYLTTLHKNIIYYIPHRYREGYGLSKIGIDYAKQAQCSLIICLDCGIKSVELINYANTLAIDFIICDHHTPDEVLPSAHAILNPKQPDCLYPFKELCGCGVGFKLITALTKHFNQNISVAYEYLDLVATAIAADIVPVTGENRILAYYGLQKINSNPNIGIAALIELSETTKDLTVSDLVFIIGPRVNAAGRMDEATKAVQLFLSGSKEEALFFAKELQLDNNDRKEADLNITEEALAILKEKQQTSKANVLYKAHWHKGVVGIVASRLVDYYYKPTVVLTKSGDIVAGSARSVHGFNIYDAIHACKDHLIGYGGHFYAAGMTLEESKVDAFTAAFENAVNNAITEEMLTPKIDIDTALQFDEITYKYYNIVKQLEPFGPENMRPVFISYHVTDTGHSKIVKDTHLKISVKQGNSTINGIGFGLHEKYALLASGLPVDIVYTLVENEWNNNVTIQIRLIDLRLSTNDATNSHYK